MAASLNIHQTFISFCRFRRDPLFCRIFCVYSGMHDKLN